MLTIAGLIVVIGTVVTLLTRTLNPVVAFTLIPTIAALLIGTSVTDIGGAIGGGLEQVSPTVMLFVLAIIFFGIMRQRGIFDPLVNGMVRLTRSDPLWVCLATVVVATFVHLDGIGAATFLVTVPAFLGIYERLGMSRLVLACLVGISAGIMNLVPWGGPTARAASALGLDATVLWRPLIPVQVFGFVLLLIIATCFGFWQRRVAKVISGQPINPEAADEASSEDGAPERLRPRQPLYWINVAVIIGALVVLMLGYVPSHIVFAIGVGVVLIINFRSIDEQMNQVREHGQDAIWMAVILISAGVFLGVLSGTGMLDAMANSLIAILPVGIVGYGHILIGLVAAPVGMAFGPDAFHFGILPIANEVVGSAGIPPESVAQAMLLGENVAFVVSPAVPSSFLLVGLAKIDFGKHVRFTLPWAWGLSVLMLGFAIVTGIIALP